MRGQQIGLLLALSGLLAAGLPLPGCGPKRAAVAESAPKRPAPAPPAIPPRNTQVQATRQFLAAALRGDTVAAKRWLSANLQAPDAGRTLAPLVAAGQHRGPDIELFKMGFLVGDDDTRPFVTYAWKADSAVTGPERAMLQVVFQDTAARQVWEVFVRE